MKKIFFSLALVSSVFAASDCNKVLEKIDAQIDKVQNQKKANPLRLEYLQNQKSEISKNCVDGKIDSVKLKEIKADTKYDYESKKIKASEEKLEAKKAKLEDNYKNEQDKIKAKQEKAEKKAEEKVEKNLEKEDVKKELNEKVEKETKKAKKESKKKAEKEN